MQDQASRIVSSEKEELILVDQDDVEVGHIDKQSAHDAGGLLHRAFSLFIFDRDGRLLMQQRSADKRLWPNFWSNSCCSHPRRGETMEEATARRLRDELNIDAELEFVYKFAYQASYDDLGAENELCWVYLGRTRDAIVPNRNEITATGWMSSSELERKLEEKPAQFTPWFKLEWQCLNQDHAQVLGKYLRGSA
jgi:isopentenyl-diphosphate Delta-isomerase